MNKEIAITAADVAAMLSADWDDVSENVRSAVLYEIVRRDEEPPAGLVKSLPVTVAVWDDGSGDQIEAEYGDDYEAFAQDLWADADYGEGDYCVTVSWAANDAAGNELACGTFDVEGHTAEPECPAADEHDWTAEYEGGCTENPGVWSLGGTAMLFTSHCRHCGMKRTERTTGSQRNPGECDTTEYSDPDADWVAKHIGDD